ncbi:MAG: fibronectin, type [Bacteroidetes bacterium]|nr:fibronectin, type [Bacteroidota bacterium]
MIKQLLTMVAIGGFAIMNAQNGKAVFQSETSTLPVGISTEKATAVTCNTIAVISPTSVSLYTIPSNTTTPGCSPNAGYVFGTNCYGFTEEATFFPGTTYSTLVSPSITAVSVGFYHGQTTLKGTKGTGPIGMRIYSGTSSTVAPGAAIVTTTTSLTNVTAAQTGTSSLFIYTFTLAPTAIPATGLYASLILPTTSAAGDTAAIYTQTFSASSYSASMPTGGAWELNGTTWSDVATDWGIKVNHLMYPVVCGSGVTSVSKNLGISNNIKIMPNPSTGVVNIAVTLGQSSNLSLNITNTLGQQITAKNYNGISNEVITLDLTNQANGIYFVTVSNGTDKMVQRLILNK